jgi:hypothetical protein
MSIKLGKTNKQTDETNPCTLLNIGPIQCFKVDDHKNPDIFTRKNKYGFVMKPSLP